MIDPRRPSPRRDPPEPPAMTEDAAPCARASRSWRRAKRSTTATERGPGRAVSDRGGGQRAPRTCTAFYATVHGDRRRAHVRARTSTSPCTTRSARRSTSRTTSTPSTLTSLTRRPGSRSGRATPGRDTAYVLRTGGRAGSIRATVRATRRRAARSSMRRATSDGELARRAAARRGPDGRGRSRSRRYVAGAALHRRRPGAPGVRRPAHRRRARAAPGPSRRPASATPSWRSSTRSAQRARAAARLRRDHRARRRAARARSSTARTMFIALYDAATERRSTSRTRSRRASGSTPSRMAIGAGPDIARSSAARRPLRARHERRSSRRSGRSTSAASTAESWLGVPILARRHVSSASIAPRERSSRTPSTRRTSGCSSTLASSMGVALENARLFDETKRLLAETDQRARRAGGHQRDRRRRLAEQLDFDGDHRARRRAGPRRSSTPQIDVHRALRRGDERDRVPVRHRRGRAVRRGRAGPAWARDDLDGHPDRAAAPARHATRSSSRPGRVEVGAADTAVVARRPDHGRRRASSASRPREPRASTPSPRPTSGSLATLPSSMGVALENARLFDETKRLLTETDQRAAELAVINEIGAALAQAARVRRHHRAGRRARALDLHGELACSSRCTTSRRTRSVPVRPRRG